MKGEFDKHDHRPHSEQILQHGDQLHGGRGEQYWVQEEALGCKQADNVKVFGDDKFLRHGSKTNKYIQCNVPAFFFHLI